MGLIKKIKNSYVFTQLEVGKYTKRRTASNPARDHSGPTESSGGVVRAAQAAGPSSSEFISAFSDQAHGADSSDTINFSTSTISNAPTMQRFRSTAELSSAQRKAQQGPMSPPLSYADSRGTTAVSTPNSAASSADDAFSGVVPRPRPQGARAARSTVDMQSVYFAPGRNVSMTNQQKQRLSMYPAAGAEATSPHFDKNSASSMDYYVFTPTRREIAQLPFDAKRRTNRGRVAPDESPSPSLHQEQEPVETNPFVERRKRAHQMSLSPTSPTTPTPPASQKRWDCRESDEPRRYLNTPVYADQAGGRSGGGLAKGLDLLA
ncbi:hypothetical protein IWW38_005413 [Coemansia aciculifera]|uniref:Uncharacterized protein n=1 Tax=Coemansia aciculifera TaxID=417176 RepID=A0ACC1LUT3_9FUNG|nr:hypothetical protein IWW38_005413 [Coemansia aciculifera]